MPETQPGKESSQAAHSKSRGEEPEYTNPQRRERERRNPGPLDQDTGYWYAHPARRAYKSARPPSPETLTGRNGFETSKKCFNRHVLQTTILDSSHPISLSITVSPLLTLLTHQQQLIQKPRMGNQAPELMVTPSQPQQLAFRRPCRQRIVFAYK